MNKKSLQTSKPSIIQQQHWICGGFTVITIITELFTYKVLRVPCTDGTVCCERDSFLVRKNKIFNVVDDIKLLLDIRNTDEWIVHKQHLFNEKALRTKNKGFGRTQFWVLSIPLKFHNQEYADSEEDFSFPDIATFDSEESICFFFVFSVHLLVLLLF